MNGFVWNHADVKSWNYSSSIYPHIVLNPLSLHTMLIKH